ncbi:MAG TPA: hypothetical protein VNZ44_17565, partial [Pyrinomonadaceae bacterium]|nr:hypothetical protein [Pyrinomonadaceae bacterium]
AEAPPSFGEGQAPAVCFIRGEDSVSVRQGGAAEFTLGVRRVEDGRLRIFWLVPPTPGLKFEPESGAVELDAAGDTTVNLRVAASAQLRAGVYAVPIKFEAVRDGRVVRDADVPLTVLEVKVGD